jgi:phage-related minor tail protein
MALNAQVADKATLMGNDQRKQERSEKLSVYQPVINGVYNVPQ